MTAEILALALLALTAVAAIKVARPAPRRVPVRVKNRRQP